MFSLRCLIWKLPGATSGLPIFPGAACNLLGHNLGVKREQAFGVEHLASQEDEDSDVQDGCGNSCVEIRF